MEYQNKIIKSGDFYHTYFYERPIKYGFQRPLKKYPYDEVIEKYETILNANIRPQPFISTKRNSYSSRFRSKKSLKLLLETNLSDSDFSNDQKFSTFFITYTFAENVQDLKEANYEFTKFIRRLNYEIYKTKTNQLTYLVVPERQARGAIHYHVIHIRLPYIEKIYDTIAGAWGKGFSWVEKIKNLHHLIAYVSKYITKKPMEDKNSRAYFCSKNLQKPSIYRGQNETMDVLPEDYEPIFERVYEAHENIIEYQCLKKI